MNATLEEKIATLTEQKRTLVKEVKNQRKKIDQNSDALNQLHETNERLINAIEAFQQHLNARLDNINKPKKEGEVATEDAATVTANLSNALHYAKNIQMTNPREHSESGHGLSLVDETYSTSATDQSHRSINFNKVAVLNESNGDEMSYQHDSAVPDGDNRAELLKMDWLSPEQRLLLQKSQQLQPPPPPYTPQDTSHLAHKRSSITDTFTSLFNKDEVSVHSSSSHGMDNSVKTTIKHSVSAPTIETVSSPKQSTSSTLKDGPNPNAPKCFRCGGTVEGPKYSTCKCDIPAMSEEEAHSSSLFKGFFDKSKHAAGGLAGSFMKASNIFSINKDEAADNDSSKQSSDASMNWSSHMSSPRISVPFIKGSPLLSLDDESEAVVSATDDPVEEIGKWSNTNNSVPLLHTAENDKSEQKSEVI
jgi:hypothetical protein